MKRKKILTSIILILLTLIFSCDVEPMKEGRSVNEYIFPYTKFTLSEDGTYYSASILNGAAVSEVYIPSYVDDFDGAIPVKYFTGFDSVDDIVNLTVTTFESSSTEIKLSSLDEAALLNTLKYKTVDKNNTSWKNLPELPNTEDEEFIGWFLVDSPDVEIRNGDVMIPGHTTLFPKWGTHTFKDVEAKEATCTESGWEAYHYCTNKGCSYTTKVEIPALGHTLIKHDEADSTCTAYGYSETCWECTRCKALFSDEGITEIEKESVIIPLKPHTSNGTYEWNDKDHWHVCSVCGSEFDLEEHTITIWEEIEGEDYVIGRCEKCPYSVKAPKEHSWSKVDAVSPTCTASGNIEYYECTNHRGEYTLSLDPVKIINKKTLEEVVIIPPNGHTFDTTKFESDEKSHWHLCTVCGASSEKEEHEFEYTFTQNGERSFVVERSCTLCGATGATEPVHNNIFDITAVFGKITVVKGSGNSWTLGYYGNCTRCYWTDENGRALVEDPDEFTITYTTEGEGSFKVFCYAYSKSGELFDISMTLLTAY